MAIWQFKVAVIPDTVVGFRDAIPEAEWDEGDWWSKTVAPDGLINELAELLPPHKSWSEDLTQWGRQDSDLIEIWRENGQVDLISARFDTRQLNFDFIRDLLVSTNKWKCRLVYERYRTVLPIGFIELKDALFASPDFKVMRDPKTWLSKMADEVEANSKNSPLY